MRLLGVIAVLTALGLCSRATRKTALTKLCLGERVSLRDIPWRAPRAREASLRLSEHWGLCSHGRVATQVIPKGQVFALLLRSSDTEMNVVSAGPTGRTLEDGIHEVDRPEGKVCVAQVS